MPFNMGASWWFLWPIAVKASRLALCRESSTAFTGQILPVKQRLVAVGWGWRLCALSLRRTEGQFGPRMFPIAVRAYCSHYLWPLLNRHLSAARLRRLPPHLPLILHQVGRCSSFSQNNLDLATRLNYRARRRTLAHNTPWRNILSWFFAVYCDMKAQLIRYSHSF